MKVKLFRFEVSNNSSNDHIIENRNQPWYQQAINDLYTEEQIENEINDFIRDKDVVSIEVSTIEVIHRALSVGNTIHLLYTIAYNNQAKTYQTISYPVGSIEEKKSLNVD